MLASMIDAQKLEGIWPEMAYDALGFSPTPLQQKVIDAADKFPYLLDPTQRLMNADGWAIALSGGQRSGKSFTQSAIAAGRMIVPGGKYWLIGPDYFHTHEEFLNLEKIFAKVGALSGKSNKPDKGAWSMRLSGGISVKTRSSHDEDTIASESIDGILMCEIGMQTLEAWEQAVSRILDKRGWIIMSGTIERASEWYITLLDRWQGPNSENGISFYMPTWTNTFTFPSIEEDLPPYYWIDSDKEIVDELDGWPVTDPLNADEESRDKPTLILNSGLQVPRDILHEDKFMMRYGAKPLRPSGLVISNFRHHIHVRKLAQEYYSDMTPAPIVLAIDPGTTCYAIVFCQIVSPTQVHVLSEIYEHDVIFDDVYEKFTEHPLSSYVTRIVMDKAGKQRHANKSQFRLWEEATGIVCEWGSYAERDTWEIIKQYLKVDKDYKRPKLFFADTMSSQKAGENLAGGVLSEFNLWRWRDSGMGNRPIDNNNHALKAIAYLLLLEFGLEVEATPQIDVAAMFNTRVEYSTRLRGA